MRDISSDSSTRVCAVIAAAGSGSRMGEGFCDKLFIEVNNRPLIFYSLKAFFEASTVDSVIIVTKAAFFDKFRGIIKEYGFGDKALALVEGGSTRQESVSRALKAVPLGTLYIAIHDGARPFVSPEIIDSVNRLAFSHGAAACCVPVKDTIKTVDGEKITGTVDRNSLVAVQTPQTFALEKYKLALAAATKSGADFTDDCQLIENVGEAVYYCPGSYNNIKVTTKEDLALCKIIAEQ